MQERSGQSCSCKGKTCSLYFWWSYWPCCNCIVSKITSSDLCLQSIPNLEMKHNITPCCQPLLMPQIASASFRIAALCYKSPFSSFSFSASHSMYRLSLRKALFLLTHFRVNLKEWFTYCIHCIISITVSIREYVLKINVFSLTNILLYSSVTEISVKPSSITTQIKYTNLPPPGSDMTTNSLVLFGLLSHDWLL